MLFIDLGLSCLVELIAYVSIHRLVWILIWDWGFRGTYWDWYTTFSNDCINSKNQICKVNDVIIIVKKNSKQFLDYFLYLLLFISTQTVLCVTLFFSRLCFSLNYPGFKWVIERISVKSVGKTTLMCISSTTFQVYDYFISYFLLK